MSKVNDFYSNKKVLVTGGAGFIGSYVVEILVSKGAKVTIPILNKTNLDFLKSVKNNITLIKCDLSDRANTDKIIKKQEIVLNLAASKGGGIANSIKHHASLFRDNIRPFINIIDSAQKEGVERFLVVSSACVYPTEVICPTPEAEGFKNEPDQANAGYGWSKRMEEYLGRAYAKEFGMKIAIARPYNAYGPRDDFFAENSHVIPGLLKKIINGDNPVVVWGSGKQTRSFLYATDFARGLLDVCEKYAVADPLNIGTQEEISMGDLAHLLIKMTGSKSKIYFDKSKPDGQPRRTCDIKKAKEKIDFSAKIKLEDGLRKTIDWYINERKLRNFKKI